MGDDPVFSIEGKLTADWRKSNPVRSGDPEYDGAALLAKIKVEKKKMIDEGKIRKEKPLAPIKPEDELFVLPEGWIWVRSGGIGIVNPRNYINDNSEVSFSPMSFISNKFGTNPRYELKKWRDVKNEFTHFAENDIAIAKITPCFENSKSCVFKNTLNGYGAGTTELHILRPIYINPLYVYIFVKTTRFLQNGETQMTGAYGQKRVPLEYFFNAMIPLPPLAEQRAIVDRVQKLLAMVDNLEIQARERKEQAEGLVRAVLREAFEKK